MPRVVILGCGTGVGKTYVSTALLARLTHLGCHARGLKPIETGITLETLDGSDAARLSRFDGAHAGNRGEKKGAASSVVTPLHLLRQGISPHLAARDEGVDIDMAEVAAWVMAQESEATTGIASHSGTWSVVETAGGVFTPLSARAVNLDLALALEPAIWVLVAADALGVLHELTATQLAMKSRGRSPDHVVLSAAKVPDASTGRNAGELATLGIAQVSAVLGRDERALDAFVGRLMAAASEALPRLPLPPS